MIDFEELEKLDFKVGDTFTKLEMVLNEVSSFAETRSAAEIAALLLKKRDDDPSVALQLDPYIAKFQALALPLLTEQEVAPIFDRLSSIMRDERIGLYERLRARLLVLPANRRKAFADAIIKQLRASGETLHREKLNGTTPQTVGSWVALFEQKSGPQNPNQFFQLPEFQKLKDAEEHAVRHLVHVVTLLSDPEGLVQTAPAQVQDLASAPAPPPNLPVESTAVDVKKKPFQPMPGAGPTAAAVIARLQQSQVGAAAPVPATVAHLTPEDEEELKKHSQKLDGFDLGPNVHDTLSKTVQAIIKSSAVTFADENLERRFITIVTSRIKDIRSADDTMALLVRPAKIGGIELNPQQAEKVVSLANNEAVKFHDSDEVKKMSELQQTVEAQALPKPPKVPQPLVSSLHMKAPFQPLPGPSRGAVPTLAAARFGVIHSTTAQGKPMERAASSTVQPLPVAAQVASAPFAPASMRPVTSERPTITDIRGASRLIGPIEELRAMTLVDFRRLGPDPISCVRRVFEKIQMIGRASITKRAEGINGWRESEVYQLYLSMGQESLHSTKAIGDVIPARQGSGQPTLSEQEFKFVADLNRILRF